MPGYWEKLSESATITAAFAPAPWGDLFGMCADWFGADWFSADWFSINRLVNVGAAAPSPSDASQPISTDSMSAAR